MGISVPLLATTRDRQMEKALEHCPLNEKISYICYHLQTRCPLGMKYFLHRLQRRHSLDYHFIHFVYFIYFIYLLLLMSLPFKL